MAKRVHELIVVWAEGRHTHLRCECGYSVFAMSDAQVALWRREHDTEGGE